MKPKQITPPQLKDATVLSLLDLNAIHFDKKHTVLTPETIATTSPEPHG